MTQLPQTPDIYGSHRMFIKLVNSASLIEMEAKVGKSEEVLWVGKTFIAVVTRL